jgi:hypothetical protein
MNTLCYVVFDDTAVYLLYKHKQEAELERQYQANLSMRDEVLQLQRQLADKTTTTDAEIEALVTAVTMVCAINMFTNNAVNMVSDSSHVWLYHGVRVYCIALHC